MRAEVGGAGDVAGGAAVGGEPVFAHAVGGRGLGIRIDDDAVAAEREGGGQVGEGEEGLVLRLVEVGAGIERAVAIEVAPHELLVRCGGCAEIDGVGIRRVPIRPHRHEAAAGERARAGAEAEVANEIVPVCLGKAGGTGAFGGEQVARVGTVEIEAKAADRGDLRLIRADVGRGSSGGIAIAATGEAALVGGEAGDDRGGINGRAAGEQGHGLRGAAVAGERGEERGGGGDGAGAVHGAGACDCGLHEVRAGGGHGGEADADVRASAAAGEGVPGDDAVFHHECRSVRDIHPAAAQAAAC